MRNLIKGIIIGVALTIIPITIITITFKPGCAYAGEPLTPAGWYRVHEWKGNPVWCHQ